jgi:hypothetical protein
MEQEDARTDYQGEVAPEPEHRVPFVRYTSIDQVQRRATGTLPCRSEEVAALSVRLLMEAGVVWEVEVLNTGEVSLTASAVVDGERDDIACELSPNDESVPDAVERLVRRVAEWHKAVSAEGDPR